MSEQLKQQTLYNVSEANTKNLIWVDVYVSGAEGSAGTYASRRMTKAQLITFLNSNLSVAWSTIASKPTTVAGFGITDAVDTLGLTADYLPKATDSNTLIDSSIRDNGTVGVNVAPNSSYTTYIKETRNKTPLRVETSQTAPSGNSTVGSFVNDTANTNTNYGVNTLVSGSTTVNVGIEGRSIGAGTSDSIGGIFSAEGTTTAKYSVQLKDGTEGTAGRFLKNITTDGKANWASLAISDVTSLQTSLDAKANIASPTFTGTVTSPAVILSSETASTIASFDASKNIKSLSTATYPSLTELSYGKGVTSSIQAQLDAKSPLNPRVQTVVSSATVTPVSTNDLVTITAQAVGLTLANPTGTFVEGQSLMIRIKDNNTAQTISFGTNYRAIGITLPTTTVISKTMYLGIIYNSTDAKFDVIGLNQQA